MEERVAGVNELRDGEMKQVLVGDKKVLLAREGGAFFALAPRCPHYGGPLSQGTLHDGHVICPWHRATFAIAGGDLLHPPALSGLVAFTVRVQGDDVYVDRPDDAKATRAMPMATFDPGVDGRTFAVVGGGAAAAAAVEALRQEGFQGRIVLISAEDRWPYDRPNLSKDYLAGTMEADWLPLRSPGFYEKHGVARLHRRVVRLHVASRAVELDDGSRMQPDAVLIATGAEPRTLDVPGADMEVVLTLRSWDSCEALRAALEGAQRVVIVGSSFIGMEAAASLLQRGLEVTVVGPGNVPFARALGEPVGAMLKAWHEEHGTAFRLGSRPVALKGSGHVTVVELDDGSELPADLVVVGIGVRPNTAFVDGVAIAGDGSLTVDAELRVAEGVWAAGDVARYPEAHTGETVRIEHWRLAEQQGRAAAAAMAGRGAPFTAVPFFWTRHFDLSVQYAGAGQGWQDLVVTGDIRARDFTVFYARDDRLLAACGTQRGEIGAFMELMREGRLPPASMLEGRTRAGLEELL